MLYVVSPQVLRKLCCVVGSATRGCGVVSDFFFFFPVAQCMKITLKKYLKWWDSEIACFEPGPFGLVSLYSGIHGIVKNTQLQFHINRYSRHIRTAELNSIPNC